MATAPGGCRQTLTVPPAGAVATAGSSRRPVVLLDFTARQMQVALRYLATPLAAAAHALTHCQGWKELGYARLSDHARERYGRSARWVRDRADLHEALERFPGLGDAMSGDDGGRPLGVVAAGVIGRIASPESLPMWLNLARCHPVRDLQKMTRAAASAGTCWPVSQASLPEAELEASDARSPGLCLMMPAAAREAFHETLALYRAVEGHEASPDDFVGSLLAEAASGPLGASLAESLPCGDESSRTSMPTADAFSGKAIPAAKRTACEEGAKKATTAPDNLAFDDVMLRRRARLWLRQVLAEAGSGGSSPAQAADDRMRRLLSLHDEVERKLDDVIIQMSVNAPWHTLGYGGLPDYAHRALGWGRSTLYARLGLVRRLQELPVVERAYSQGRIGRMAAQTISRMLLRNGSDASGLSPVPVDTQQAWVKRAAVATFRRLQDETRTLARLIVMGTGDSSCEPLNDQDWHASLRRQPGMTLRRLEALTHMALTAPAPFLPLRLYLEPETAGDLLRVLAVARRDPALVQTFARFQQERQAAPSGKGRRRSGVPTFPSARDDVPLWAALLALLQEFAVTWDVDRASRRPWARKIYNRDGWRCMSPGCTSRRNLEVHHVVYRSRGGHDRPGNLICVCRFHHQMGEHGLLAQVRGEAPLGLVWWLGRDGSGGRFRNDLRLTG